MTAGGFRLGDGVEGGRGGFWDDFDTEDDKEAESFSRTGDADALADMRDDIFLFAVKGFTVGLEESVDEEVDDDSESDFVGTVEVDDVGGDEDAAGVSSETPFPSLLSAFTRIEARNRECLGILRA